MKSSLTALLLGPVLMAASAVVAAAEFPARPIRVLVPFAPGGVVDTSTRILTSKLTERNEWQFVVDNRPGGNGFIAVQIAARAVPDGYTLLSAHTGEFAVNPNVFKSVPYDFDKDFTSIIMVSDAPMLVVVNAQSPINSLKDLIAQSRVKPVTFGSPGTGSVNHMASEWLVSAAKMNAVHVPYKGGAPAVSAVAGGEVTFTVAGLPGVLPHLQAKRVKVIGSTTAKRTAQTPDWPTAQELGVPGVDASIWVGLFAPRGTPALIVNRLYKASADALQLPEVRERLAVVGGAEAVALSPADTNARVKRDAQRYRKVVQDVALPLQ